MFRFLALAALATPALVHPAAAEDAITPETIDAVKKATVFIRVQGDGWAAAGSGFVVRVGDAGVLVATNDHVAAAVPPPGVRPSARPAVLTVVFDSGTKAERSYTGTVAAADPDRDLAVLRVGGVKDPPKPIPYADPPKWVETTPVYSFGFPFGTALATAKGFPAVTVGKASISSLRTGDDGELAVVQIEGNLNPGNSGGPVVDGKGRLVGVAVATVRDGRGIGLTVPGTQLVRLMDGRLGWVRANAHKPADGSAVVRVFAEVIDPAGNLRAPVAHYVVVPPGEKRPDAAALDKHPGSRRAELKTDGGVASAEFAVPAAAGEVLVQVTAERAMRPAAATPVRAFSLAPPPKAADPAGPPPPGWKVHTARGRAFAMWVPANAPSQGEEERTVTIAGEQMTVTAVDGRTTGGLAYEGESILLPAAVATRPPKDLHDLIRRDLLTEIKGRVVESKVVEMGTVAGEEYAIQAGPLTTRVRVFVSGPRAYLVRVTGTADQLARKEADTLLAAFHLPGPAKAPAVATAPKKEATPPRPKPPTPPPAATTTPKAKDPTILGGYTNNTFKDAAPDGGLLVGFEFGLVKPFGREVIRGVRPIFRAGEKETLGEQHGAAGRTVTVKAKDGYAVGRVTARHFGAFEGCSVTFMKVADGKLDAADSYESEWVGSEEANKTLTKLGGDGTPVLGVVGRVNDKEMVAMGVLLKGQEGFTPKR